MARAQIGRMAFDAVKHLFAPKGSTKLDLAMRYLPDIGFATIGATAYAPEDATMLERAGLFAEDLALGLGASVAGQQAGRGVAKLGQRGKATADRLNIGSNVGDVAGQLGMSFLPRPITQAVYEAAGERANQSQEQVAAAQQEMLEQEMLASMVIGGLQAGGAAVPAARQMIPPGIASAMNLTTG